MRVPRPNEFNRGTVVRIRSSSSPEGAEFNEAIRLIQNGVEPVIPLTGIVIIVTLVLDGQTGEIVQGPDLNGHGFMVDPSEVFKSAADAVRRDVAAIEEFPVDFEALRRHVKTSVNRITRKATGRKAVVIPVILEV